MPTKVGLDGVTTSQSEEERLLTGTPFGFATKSKRVYVSEDSSGYEEVSDFEEISGSEEASAHATASQSTSSDEADSYDSTPAR